MVRAILAGTKTQTRRIVKGVTGDKPNFGAFLVTGKGFEGERRRLYYLTEERDRESFVKNACPYGVPGDRLWVRETWATAKALDDLPPRVSGERTPYWFQADDFIKNPPRVVTSIPRGKWRPSIHMPRWASRLSLEVVSVRVERLQEISEEDAKAEGCSGGTEYDTMPGESHLMHPIRDVSAKEEDRDLWERINGKGSWDLNPWVWVVESRRIQP